MKGRKGRESVGIPLSMTDNKDLCKESKLKFLLSDLTKSDKNDAIDWRTRNTNRHVSTDMKERNQGRGEGVEGLV